MKILIIVKGGVIQHIVANDADVEIFTHDYDNAEGWTIEDENDFASSTSPDEIVSDKKFNDYVYDAYFAQERKLKQMEKEDVLINVKSSSMGKTDEELINYPHPQLEIFK